MEKTITAKTQERTKLVMNHYW